MYPTGASGAYVIVCNLLLALPSMDLYQRACTQLGHSSLKKKENAKLIPKYLTYLKKNVDYIIPNSTYFYFNSSEILFFMRDEYRIGFIFRNVDRSDSIRVGKVEFQEMCFVLMQELDVPDVAKGALGVEPPAKLYAVPLRTAT